MFPFLAKLTRPHNRPETNQVDADHVLRLLRRPSGATVDELADTLGLTPRQMRGYLNGPLRQALSHKVPSQSLLGLIRVYRLPVRRRS